MAGGRAGIGGPPTNDMFTCHRAHMGIGIWMENPAPIAAGSLASRAIIGARSPSHPHAQLGQSHVITSTSAYPRVHRLIFVGSTQLFNNKRKYHVRKKVAS